LSNQNSLSRTGHLFARKMQQLAQAPLYKVVAEMPAIEIQGRFDELTARVAGYNL
jgi:hypothetical protein